MKILHQHNRIGIWGFGVMGKSAISYLHGQGYQVSILDKRVPTLKEQEFLQENNIVWYTEKEQDLFFNFSDFIIPSPGINISELHYATYKHKFISEFDFFYQHFSKPIIAITGSVGKTSTTSILAKIFAQLAIPVAVGGNIGTPTFDLIDQHNNVDYALLEVSSFQLMHCTSFAPQLAIWTNFYPNHLDYHATEDEYFLAKYNIFKQQSSHAFSCLPLSLREKIPAPHKNHIRAYFTLHEPTDELSSFCNNELAYYAKNNMVWRYISGIHIPLIPLTPEMYALSFLENIIITTAICDTMKLNIHALQTIAAAAQLPAHRLEHIGTVSDITFYNDSKATTTASTLAAVNKLKNRPLHLFLGGLSKGVDRAPFVAQLKNNVKYIYCFGKEAEHLYILCKNNSIPAAPFTTLDDAVDACIMQLEPHDCVLLSPAGSSYDLYENYEKRGNHFKELIASYIKKSTIL